MTKLAPIILLAALTAGCSIPSSPDDANPLGEIDPRVAYSVYCVGESHMPLSFVRREPVVSDGFLRAVTDDNRTMVRPVAGDTSCIIERFDGTPEEIDKLIHDWEQSLLQ